MNYWDNEDDDGQEICAECGESFVNGCDEVCDGVCDGVCDDCLDQKDEGDEE